MPRPRLEPTDELRRLVKSLSAFGVPQKEIARRIGIRSTKTLRAHYRTELDRGALEANMSVTQTLYKMATSGNHPVATLFWLKVRAGWQERPSQTVNPLPSPPFVVAKENGVEQP
ncbi:MAG: hypothetical protein ABSE86_29650 [Bryobacteraceae bacterium]|jgi:hypothetical protein